MEEMVIDSKFTSAARSRGGTATAKRAARFDMDAAYKRWRLMLNEMYKETT